MTDQKRITVNRVSNTRGFRYRATLWEGNGGKGFTADTAEQAEALLRESYDCEGIEASYGKSQSLIYTDGTPVEVDRNGLITQTFTDHVAVCALLFMFGVFFATLMIFPESEIAANMDRAWGLLR